MLALLSEVGFAGEPAIALPGSRLTVKIWTARKQSGTRPNGTVAATGKTSKR